MRMRYRAIDTTDVEDLIRVRISTDENSYSREGLGALGITPETVRGKLSSTHKGWLCEADGRVVGFAIGDRSSGELWVIAVLPEHVNRGIGSRLLALVESWLRECGCRRLWLTTDIDTKLRAYSFYLGNGWRDDRIEHGLRYMVKDGGFPDQPCEGEPCPRAGGARRPAGGRPPFS